MKYFIIEGMLNDAKLMDQAKLNEHIQYTQRAMDKGLILLSGLKEDESGGIFVMKANSRDEIDEYLSDEPFQRCGIQNYNVIEFTPHYFNESPNQWLDK